MLGRKIKYPFALLLILSGNNACHKTYPVDQDLSLYMTESYHGFDKIKRHMALSDIDGHFASVFPRLVAVQGTEINPPQLSTTIDETIDMTEAQMLFVMPVEIHTICIGRDCGKGIDLHGFAEMVIDLDQRLVTLQEFDLTNDGRMFHLSGEMTFRFQEFGIQNNEIADAMLSLATPDRIINTDLGATFLINDADLDASQVSFQFQASSGRLFFDGSGVTNNKLK